MGMLMVVAGCGRLGFGISDEADGGDASETTPSTPSDAATSDAPTAMDDAAPALTCLPSYVVCDGFEGSTISTTTWQVDSMITLDTSRAHRGASSAHVHMPAFGSGQSNHKFLGDTKTLTAAATFWVRGWFWLSALPAGTNGLELITAELPGASGDYLFVRSNRTTVYSQFQDNSTSSTTTVPTGSWFCVVFRIVRSTTTAGSLSLSGDAPAIALNNARTDGAPAITHVNLGIGFSDRTSAPRNPRWISGSTT